MKVKIKVTNFDKYNPRRDQKKATWFRLDCDFWRGPDFFSYSNDEKMIFIALLSECGAKMRDETTVDIAYIASMLKLETIDTKSALEKFERDGFISIISDINIEGGQIRADAHESGDARTLRTNERTNERNEQISDKRTHALAKFNDDDLAIAAQWVIHSESLLPNRKFDLHTFASDISKIRSHANLEPGQCVGLLRWISGDDFWRKNAITPSSLLKRSKSNPDLKKLDLILAQISSSTRDKRTNFFKL